MTSTRVVLTARASADADRLLAEASALARAMHAELVGMFVEATELLRVAALPVTREVGASSGSVRGLDVTDTIRLLERQASEVRTLVARAATGLDLPWSFQVTRGDLVEAALHAARTDLVLLAPQPSPHQRTLGPERPRARPGTVAAVYDGTPAGQRALEAALSLAGRRADAVSLAVPPAAAATLSQVADLRRLAADALPPAPGEPSAVPLAEVRRRLAPRVLVVSVATLAAAGIDVRNLLTIAGCPLVLVP